MSFSVIVSDIVLAGPFVTEKKKHVLPVSNGQEVRNGMIFAGLRVEPPFHQRTEVFPSGQIPRVEEMVHAYAVYTVLTVFECAGNRVITVVFLPDTGIEDPVRSAFRRWLR